MGFHYSCLPSWISRFFCIHYSRNTNTALKKNYKESFWMYIGNFSWKDKKIPWCRSGFPLLFSSLSNFEIFFAFIILEIRAQIKKKLWGIFLNVYRIILVKEKKNPWCRSGFPLLLSWNRREVPNVTNNLARARTPPLWQWCELVRWRTLLLRKKKCIHIYWYSWSKVNTSNIF